MKPFIFLLFLFQTLNCFAFHDCADISQQPEAAPKLFEIIRSNNGEPPTLKPVDESTVIDQDKVFHAVNENFRFTTYRCWDADRNTTGFDPNLITEIVASSGEYDYIRFTSIPWSQSDGEPISFFTHLDNTILEAHAIDNNGNVKGGSIAQAGMSITEERLKWGYMVGPIYKAGKILIGRVNDNPRLNSSKVSQLLQIPQPGKNRYNPLRGLTLVTEGNGSIRGKYFLEMSKNFPELIHFLDLEEPTADTDGDEIAQKVSGSINKEKFNVILTSNSLINKLIDHNLTNGTELFGVEVDLTLIDTGSVNSLKAEGKIATNKVEVVSQNLSLVDDKLGFVFGTGDGIVVSKVNDEMRQFIEENLKTLICNKRLDALIQRWFDDTNSADLAWAQCPGS